MIRTAYALTWRNRYFLAAFLFLMWAYGWTASVGWWLIVLFDKHNRMKG